MRLSGNCCFFAHVNNKRLLQQEQMAAQDIKILREIGFSVTTSTCFRGIPWGCDLYFAWWASGSILPLIKAFLSRKPIIVVAGGQEAVLNRNSISGVPFGYLASPWYKKLAIRICLRYSTVVLVVSNYMVKDVKKLGALNPLVVYNCIDTKAFNLSNRPRIFVTTIFRSDEHAVMIKREEIFIRSIPFVLRDFPEQKFVVIGEKGNAYQRLQQLVSDLGIERNIEFTGDIDNWRVPEFLQRSKVYVQISESETFGVSIAEAMSCGTPIVVSRQGAIPEVVGDCGTYVDHNDPKSVAAGIINLLRKSEGERHEIGLKARSRIVENFSYMRRKKSIQHIIEGVYKMRGMTNGYKICTKCIMDATDKEIIFDENGVCNHCKNAQKKLKDRNFYLDKEIKKKLLEQKINEIEAKGRNKKYDCVIGVSGGVDSTFVAYKVKKYDLRPYAFHLDNGWNSEIAEKNIENIARKLGIKIHKYKVNWNEFKDLQMSFLKALVPDVEIPTDHALAALFFRNRR